MWRNSYDGSSFVLLYIFVAVYSGLTSVPVIFLPVCPPPVSLRFLPFIIDQMWACPLSSSCVLSSSHRRLNQHGAPLSSICLLFICTHSSIPHCLFWLCDPQSAFIWHLLLFLLYQRVQWFLCGEATGDRTGLWILLSSFPSWFVWPVSSVHASEQAGVHFSTDPLAKPNSVFSGEERRERRRREITGCWIKRREISRTEGEETNELWLRSLCFNYTAKSDFELAWATWF